MGWEGRGKSILVKQRENFIVVIFAKIKEANEKKVRRNVIYLFITKAACFCCFQMCQEWLHLPMVSPLLWGAFL